ncbi:cytochrome c3 family protein [Bordetella bronchialis]|uniref:Cytochrome C n=1 Tax=Bordetella bronchialis TaxID=463025 RepID=A0A193FXL4_9BORD|nr:cytochrome c3 family protein [Bordetella bronchialis]ANN72365.1 cytochrome C [Bordetella bronchialis]
MSQVFDKAAVLCVKLVLIGTAILAAVTIAAVAWRMDAPVAAQVAVAQPIPFSHKHHVGDDGIDCRYCHVSVQTSASAGMPSAGICLTCHAVLFKDAPVLAPLHASAATGIPIHWNRVYDLPDFVYFDHSVHVAKGVACVSCHGRVDQMPQLVRNQPLEMQWCLDCHRAPEKRVVPPDQVFTMRDPAALSDDDVASLRRIFHFESEERMTSCTTCHR